MECWNKVFNSWIYHIGLKKKNLNECVEEIYRLNCVRAKVQNSYVLGLGLTRVLIDKYWILILIRKPEFPRRYEWEIEDY